MMTSIKAAVCYKFGAPLVVDEIFIDEPRANEVRVKVNACAICHSDIIYMDGEWGGALPTVYGHEASGVVEACGDYVHKVKVGDPVIISLLRSCGQCYFCTRSQYNLCEHTFATDEPRRLLTTNGISIHRGLRTGCFAEYAVIHQSQVVKIPTSLGIVTASLLGCGVITGFGSVVNTANVQEGDYVVVIGTGGVGINCIQAARVKSAGSIIAIDISSERLEVAKKLGATHLVNSLESDPVDFILKHTGNRGADFVFAATGAPAATDNIFRLVRRGGKVILVGMPAEGVKFSFETLDFIDNNQSLLGSKMGSSNLSTDIPELIALYESGNLELDSLVTATYPLEAINDAIDAARNAEGMRHVILL